MRNGLALEWSLGAAGPLLARDADHALSWRDGGACATADPELWFPEKGGSTREAKRVCRSCEVRTECLEYALDNDERFGIWGGLSERERRRIKPPAAGPRMCGNKLHPMTAENTGDDGRCLGCKQARKRRRVLAAARVTGITARPRRVAA